MEPLSVASAVVGIVAAAGKMIPTLVIVISTYSDAPKYAKDVLVELQAITAAVKQLGTFIDRKIEVSPLRQQLVVVQQLQVTLAECVTTYSQLEPILDTLGSIPAKTAWNRAKWMYKESDIHHILQRLQTHREMLSLILNILLRYVPTSPVPQTTKRKPY